MEDIFRTILNNYRDIAFYDRALNEIVFAIEGISISPISYHDKRLSYILCTIQKMQQELKELHEKLDNIGKTENYGQPSE